MPFVGGGAMQSLVARARGSGVAPGEDCAALGEAFAKVVGDGPHPMTLDRMRTSNVPSAEDRVAGNLMAATVDVRSEYESLWEDVGLGIRR